MAQSPENNSDGLIICNISSNGSKISDSFGIISVWVRREVNKIGFAKIVLEAGNTPKQETTESDDETFALGRTITIEAGYKQGGKKIFEGVISSHSLEIEENENKLIIECREFAYPMMLSKTNKVFENKKDSEVIRELIGGYNLEANVKSTPLKYNDLVQYYCSDWDFMLSRSILNGMIVITDGKNVNVAPPILFSSPLLVVTYGKDMITFKGNLQTDRQASDVEAYAVDSAKQKLVNERGSNPTLNEQGTLSSAQLTEALGINQSILQTNMVTDESTLKSWADSQLLKAGLSRIIGEVKFQGNADAKLGGTITLAGLSKHFNGDAFINMVEHEIKKGMWTTTAGIGLSPNIMDNNSNVMASSTSALLPGIQGMHIGKIIKIDEDPDNENKLQVEISSLTGENNKIWARLATFWASNQYGAFFIPDIGDEVVLGFFNNNPCSPVILGSLYSSKQSPASGIQKENNIRSIVTKSKLKIEFEEEKKNITITTPGNNIIEISDEGKSIKITDLNKNKIEMTNSGIAIESSQSLSLKAKTNIKIEAGTNIDIRGKEALNLKATTIEASADTTFTAKGSAKAELSAAGQTVVKGAMVMIN
jgi:Rhs element Vgr protein